MDSNASASDWQTVRDAEERGGTSDIPPRETKFSAAYVTGATTLGTKDTKPTPPPCGHTGDKVIFRFKRGGETTTLHGARGMSISAYHTKGAALVIDCAKVFDDAEELAFVSGASADRFLKELNDADGPIPEYLQLRWKDYGVPEAGLKFWLKLRDMLPAGKVLVCCLGGHGRTGTALTALLIVLGKSYAEALELVRTRHCGKAVETAGQEHYLEKLAKAYAEHVKAGGR